MEARRELEHVRHGAGGEMLPAGFDTDLVEYEGGAGVLELARAVLSAQLEGRELPDWFVERCIDDAEIQTCEVRRWSLRAWRYWLDPENRRWWWWEARVDGDTIRLTVLVRARPYLRGALDWLFTVACEAARA
jgi:hypothetical protein